jgi:FlaA1/EpsC-like NDP-sugar epimerase
MLADVVRDRTDTIAPMPEFPKGFTVLITGACGSIGCEVQKLLKDTGVKVFATDIEELDVTNKDQVDWWIHRTHPDVVLHLAGAKHAPAGEEHPTDPLEVNAIGTRLVADAAYANGARLVTASTCKACDPETAYGASKLLAERITLNMGGTVARFHNVVETAGNVFEIWRNTPTDQPLMVASACRRYFISLREAAHLAIWCLTQNGGRYCVDPGEPRFMQSIATDLYAERELITIEPRRGDRLIEPLHAQSETASVGRYKTNPRIPSGVLRIDSVHDAVEVAA